MSKTAVVIGGPSPEHDVSILTGLQTARELSANGHEVTMLYWSKTGSWFRVPVALEGFDFLQGVPRNAEPVQLLASSGGGFVTGKKGWFAKSSPLEIDVVVVCCHGGPGENGALQSALDLAGLTYTGPNAANAAIGMDKLAFAGVMVAAGFPTLPRVAVSETTSALAFAGPYILKPRFGGSSIGIEIIDSLETAKALLRSSVHFADGAVIEPYRPNSFDLNVGIRLYPSPQVSAIEKPVRSADNSEFLGYADKYVGGEGMVSAPRELPANIALQLTKTIQEMALHVAELVGVRGVQRLDFLLDGDDLYVNEINTIPGSHSKHLWVEPLVPFAGLLEGMIDEAKSRPSIRWATDGADGSALRSAGSIAGKLS